MLLGMSKKEIQKMFYAIIRFADIGKFIDAPLFMYSSGMKLRLGFAVAVHANPDILILDEGFSVGDKKFQEKCNEKIDQLFRIKKTVLSVSHWLEYLTKYYNRIIWIDKGTIYRDGTTNIVKHYQRNYA